MHQGRIRVVLARRGRGKVQPAFKEQLQNYLVLRT